MYENLQKEKCIRFPVNGKIRIPLLKCLRKKEIKRREKISTQNVKTKY